MNILREPYDSIITRNDIDLGIREVTKSSFQSDSSFKSESKTIEQVGEEGEEEMEEEEEEDMEDQEDTENYSEEAKDQVNEISSIIMQDPYDDFQNKRQIKVEFIEPDHDSEDENAEAMEISSRRSSRVTIMLNDREQIVLQRKQSI